MYKQATKTRRKPGRPAAATAPDVRACLLQAARTLFTERDIGAVSSREIANAAHVNPALINYYFGGKTGLYETMLEDTIAPILSRLGELQHAPDAASLHQVMTLFTRTLAANPWVPRLILREVLSKEGRFRERFIELVAGRGSGLLTGILEDARQRNLLRDDLDIRLTALSFISLMLFPFLAMPVASRVFNLDSEPATLDALVEHSHALFWRGITNPANRPEDLEVL